MIQRLPYTISLSMFNTAFILFVHLGGGGFVILKRLLTSSYQENLLCMCIFKFYIFSTLVPFPMYIGVIITMKLTC